MSNVHILEKVQNKTVNCIFHIAVPDTTNAVGTNWRDAIRNSKAPEALMSYNDADENTYIEAGSVLEVAETVRFSSTNLTNAQRLAEVTAAYNSRKTELLEELQDELDFFGKEG